MKRIKIILVTLLVSIYAYGQPDHIIRFIHGGIESHPVGTIIISVERVVPLTDAPTDSIFGQSIKTDIKTFMLVRKLLRKDKYKTPGPRGERDKDEWLRITDSDGFVLYLLPSKYNMFFYELKSLLKRKKRGKDIIAAFKYY